MRRSFPRHLVSKAWILFFRVSKHGQRSTAMEEDWGWQETRRAWTCLRSWWCATVRSYLVWPLLRQSWCRLLQSRCHSCTGLLSYCVLISSFVQNSKAKSKRKNEIVWNWSSQAVYSPLSRRELFKKNFFFLKLGFIFTCLFILIYVSKIEDSFFLGIMN